jgi:hypothetical protein
MFNTLQGRSNAEWFGDNEKKASLGRFKVVVSTHGFVSEMHRRVQVRLHHSVTRRDEVAMQSKSRQEVEKSGCACVRSGS